MICFSKSTYKVEVFMVSIKALLTGLTGASLCMANISGTVTDTGGSTPIPGVVVQLENGGQTATTGIDGRFTLVVSSAVLPGNSRSLTNGLSARITRNLMTVTISERSAVEVATFDLNGKALSTVRTTMDAGSHSLSIPYQGAGIYLYKVKSGNNEFVLKGNAVGGISCGSPVTSQGSSSKPLAKQAMSTAAINDVIAATKTGYLNYRVVAYNPDTTGIEIKMIACAGTVTDVDGNVYQTVRIGNQVWTTENLRVTKYNDGSVISLDTSSVTWYSTITPKYCFYNNTTNADSIKKYGALYNWYVVSPANPKKIAPAGWHVPTDAEWTTLEKHLVFNGYNWGGTTDTTHNYNGLAKSLATKTDWYTSSFPGTIGCDMTKNNSSGFSGLPGGIRNAGSTFHGQRGYGFWWSVTEDAWHRVLYYNWGIFYRNFLHDEGCGFSVRLVRD
jgi:uncharacterized protein (TIGR02145 family)